MWWRTEQFLPLQGFNPQMCSPCSLRRATYRYSIHLMRCANLVKTHIKQNIQQYFIGLLISTFGKYSTGLTNRVIEKMAYEALQFSLFFHPQDKLKSVSSKTVICQLRPTWLIPQAGKHHPTEIHFPFLYSFWVIRSRNTKFVLDEVASILKRGGS